LDAPITEMRHDERIYASLVDKEKNNALESLRNRKREDWSLSRVGMAIKKRDMISNIA